MFSFLNIHATSTGVPKEFLFFLLLMTVALLMRTTTCIAINQNWKELALLQPLQEVEKKQEKDEDEDNGRPNETAAPHWSLPFSSNVQKRQYDTRIIWWDDNVSRTLRLVQAQWKFSQQKDCQTYTTFWLAARNWCELCRPACRLKFPHSNTSFCVLFTNQNRETFGNIGKDLESFWPWL